MLGYIGFAMKAKTKWGTHSSPTASLGTGDKCPIPTHPKCRVWFGTGRGAKVFYPLRPDYKKFKIPSFTSPGHTHSHVCAPFSFCRIVGNPLSSRYFYALPYILAISYIAHFFRALTASGGGHAPPPPWGGTGKIVN